MKKSKKITLYAVGFIALVAILLMAAGQAKAQWFDFGYDTPTSNVTGFKIPTGQYCLTDYRDGNAFTTCYCACEDDCIVVVEEVDPEPTPEPTPEEKPKCNAGRGNDSEGDPDCDPGNSGGHNQGGD